MSRELQVTIYAVVSIYYLSSIYDSSIASVLKAGKWSLLGLLTAILLVDYSRARRPLPRQSVNLLLMVALAPSIVVSSTMALSLATFASVAVPLVASCMLAGLLRTIESRRRFFEIIANVGRLVITSAAIMAALHINLGRSPDRITAWTDNPNTLGLLLAPTIIILLVGVVERKRGWFIWNGAFIFVGLVLLRETGARASILWIIVSFYSLWVARNGAHIGTFVAITGVSTCVLYWDEISYWFIEFAGRTQEFEGMPTGNYDYSSGRDDVWQYGMQLFGHHPLFGYGLGTSENLIEAHDWTWSVFFGGTFHNSYLQLLVEAGLIGTVFFIVIGVIPVLVRGALQSGRFHRAYGGDWIIAAMPWAIFCGALAHGFFETWLVSGGNQNFLILWTCAFMVRNQAVQLSASNTS